MVKQTTKGVEFYLLVFIIFWVFLVVLSRRSGVLRFDLPPISVFLHNDRLIKLQQWQCSVSRARGNS